MSKLTDSINAYYAADNRHRGAMRKVAEAEEALKEAKRVEESAYMEVMGEYLRSTRLVKETAKGS